MLRLRTREDVGWVGWVGGAMRRSLAFKWRKREERMAEHGAGHLFAVFDRGSGPGWERFGRGVDCRIGLILAGPRALGKGLGLS